MRATNGGLPNLGDKGESKIQEINLKLVANCLQIYFKYFRFNFRFQDSRFISLANHINGMVVLVIEFVPATTLPIFSHCLQFFLLTLLLAAYLY